MPAVTGQTGNEGGNPLMEFLEITLGLVIMLMVCPALLVMWLIRAVAIVPFMAILELMFSIADYAVWLMAGDDGVEDES